MTRGVLRLYRAYVGNVYLANFDTFRCPAEQTEGNLFRQGRESQNTLRVFMSELGRSGRLELGEPRSEAEGSGRVELV